MSDDQDQATKVINPVLDRIVRVLVNIASRASIVTQPDVLPLLGMRYPGRITKFFARRNVFRRKLLDELGAIPPGHLFEMFDSNGDPASPEGEEWIASAKQEFKERFQVTIWERIALDQERYTADYQHWVAMPFVSPAELTLLSVGLEPSRELLNLLEGPQASRSPGISEEEFLLKRFTLLTRWLDAEHADGRPGGEALKAFFDRTKLEITVGFRRLLDERASVGAGPVSKHENPFQEGPDHLVPQKAEPALEQFDPRQRKSLVKLAYVMAVKGYSFDPSKPRNTAVTEIISDFHQMGMSISRDTLLAILREGARHLPTQHDSEQEGI